MGDMAEVFNEMNQRKKEKRAKNTVDSTAILKAHNIKFVSHNGGAHLQLFHVCGVINFWPSTGLWIVAHSNKKYRGVRNLLKYCGVEKV